MDKICKSIVFGGLAEVTAFDTTELVQKARELHKTSPVATVALGKVLSIGAYMSSTLKNDGDRFSISITCDGPIQNLVVAGNSKLQVRGYLENPDFQLEKLGSGKENLREAFGSGTINVIKDLGLKECYTGKSEVVNGNVDEDFAWYFTKSEGVPTALAMAVNLDENGDCTSAGGIIIQPLPGCPEEVLVILEDISMNFGIMDKLVAARDPHKLIDDYFGHFEIKYFDPVTPVYQCICSPLYMEGVVRAIGRGECVNILMERGSIEIKCHFCGKVYNFSKEEVVDIWQRYDKLNKK
ncbi:MAG: Hsp33 family molecular chaperone HslO [Clostridia bacterium]|nr:Hsp33 family molecular chaperone HslO [Clostridia bacterium]